MSARRAWLKTIIVFLSVCLGTTGLWALINYSAYHFRHQYDNLTLDQLQQKTDITFPASAKMLRHSAIVGLSGEIRAKIAISKKDGISFTRSLSEQAVREHAELSTKDKLGIDTLGYEIPEWWHPGSPRQFMAVRFPGDIKIVFVDLDRSDTVTVYLLWGH